MDIFIWIFFIWMNIFFHIDIIKKLIFDIPNFLFLEIVNVICPYKRDNLTKLSFYKCSEVSFFFLCKTFFLLWEKAGWRLIKRALRWIISNRLAKGVVSVNEDVPVAKTKEWTNEKKSLTMALFGASKRHQNAWAFSYSINSL
jgi:hypothetical protein